MKASLVAGAFVGIATGAWMFAEYALGLHADPKGPGRWTGFLALVFPLAASVWLVRTTRPRSWRVALMDGAVFGAVGGLVGGAAILFYFKALNPGFAIDGRPVDGWTQALTGFTGSLIIGLVLTLIVHAVLGRKGYGNG